MFGRSSHSFADKDIHTYFDVVSSKDHFDAKLPGIGLHLDRNEDTFGAGNLNTMKGPSPPASQHSLPLVSSNNKPFKVERFLHSSDSNNVDEDVQGSVEGDDGGEVTGNGIPLLKVLPKIKYDQYGNRNSGSMKGVSSVKMKMNKNPSKVERFSHDSFRDGILRKNQHRLSPNLPDDDFHHVFPDRHDINQMQSLPEVRQEPAKNSLTNNPLYGTAIQEAAGRVAQGQMHSVQKWPGRESNAKEISKAANKWPKTQSRLEERNEAAALRIKAREYVEDRQQSLEEGKAIPAAEELKRALASLRQFGNMFTGQQIDRAFHTAEQLEKSLLGTDHSG